MTTMGRDSCANLGILGMFDAMFRPAAVLASHTKNPPGHDDPDDELEDEEAIERERAEADDYRAMYAEDSEPDICGPLFDGR